MWPIIYRILVPGVVVFILSGFFAFMEIKSLKKKKKKGAKKKKIIAAIAYICIAIFGVILSGFFSLDLILQDYITAQGTYTKLYRDREVYVFELYFSVNGDEESCSVFSSDVKEFKTGHQYEFTYAKRTGMLISFKEI